jgi:hypothetical protein
MTEENRIKDDQKFEDIYRTYTIYELPKDHPIKKGTNVNQVRIYDRSLLYIQRKGDSAFIRTKHKLLREDEVLTVFEAQEIYKKKGVWTDAEEQKKINLQNKVEKINEKRDYLIAEIDKEEDEKKIRKLQKSLDEFDVAANEVLVEYRKILNKELVLFADTAEMQAEEARQKTYLLYAVCKDEGPEEYSENKRIWGSMEELETVLTIQNVGEMLGFARIFWEVRKGVGEVPFFDDTLDEETSDSDIKSEKIQDKTSSKGDSSNSPENS